MRASVVIPAAGSGSRFKKSAGNFPEASTKKQFLSLDGLPIFIWSLLPFFEFEEFVEWILVIDPQDENEFKFYLTESFSYEHGLSKKLLQVKLITGGSERCFSVANGIDACRSDVDKVFIHDAARPLLKISDLKLLLDECQKSEDGIVPGEMLKDSIKKVDAQGVVIQTPRRQDLRAVSTPQIFELKAVKAAYQKVIEQQSLPTDDAEVYTANGGKVKVLLLEFPNPKVTTLEDWRRLAGERNR